MSDMDLLDLLIDVAKNDINCFYSENMIDIVNGQVQIHIDLLCDKIMNLIPNDMIVHVMIYDKQEPKSMLDDKSSYIDWDICVKYPNIQVCSIIDNHLIFLELPNFIKDMTIIGCPDLFTINSCSNLKNLVINRCRNLKYIEDMPSLQTLTIYDCKSLEKLPETLITLHSDPITLKKVNLSNLTKIQNIHIHDYSGIIPRSVRNIIELYETANLPLNIHFD